MTCRRKNFVTHSLCNPASPTIWNFNLKVLQQMLTNRRAENYNWDQSALRKPQLAVGIKHDTTVPETLSAETYGSRSLTCETERVLSLINGKITENDQLQSNFLAWDVVSSNLIYVLSLRRGVYSLPQIPQKTSSVQRLKSEPTFLSPCYKF
jgi:hypothetical protein